MFHVDHILCPFSVRSPSRADSRPGDLRARPDDYPALAQSLYLADRLGATVHVVPIPESGAPGSEPKISHADRVETARAIADRLSLAVDVVSPPPTVPLQPSPADLLNYADAANVDLLVIDTPTDRGPIPPMASDPVRTFVERAPMPVFVAEHAGDPASIRRILVPVDFSEHAREALQHAKYLADLYGASIDLLHVIERPQFVALNPTDMLAFSDATLTERKALRRIDTFFQHTNGVDIPARTHLAHGDAADQIVHFACEHAIDLVVLSTHGVIGRPQHPLGTVADKVLRRVACPLVLTRAFGRSLV
jgi:nucleotide-binding universal stress UspA family protein